MKKILWTVASIMMLVSCNKEACEVDTPSGKVLQTISVTVKPYENLTKVSVNNDRTSTWTSGDQLGIYPVNSTVSAGQTSQQIVFNIVNPSQSSTSAVFSGTGWGLVTDGNYQYFSYYPYSTSALYNEVPVSYKYDLIQSSNNSTAHLGCNEFLYAPPICPSDHAEATFGFCHLGAFVRFTITVPDSVKTRAFTRFEVEASSASPFTKTGTYDPSTATATVAPTITSSETTDKLILYLNSSNGIVPDGEGKLLLYFLVAPAAVTNVPLSIKLIDINDNVYVASRTPTSDITSGSSTNFAISDLSPKPAETATDLSKFNTANCYIVSQMGKYMFKATIKGNGVVPAGMTESSSIVISNCKADVIWETNNTATAPEVGSIVSNAHIDGNYIVFDATGAQGNALIALKNKSTNEIVWSWHIWSTSANLDNSVQNYGGVNMMDRNLGALSAEAGNNLTCGFLYQWGRQCPITGGCSLSNGTARMVTTNSTVWDNVATSATNGTLAYSAAHPTHFIGESATNYFRGTSTASQNWLWTADATTGYASGEMPELWSATTKTMYDPCPIGWKVPAAGVWSNFSTSTFTYGDYGRTYTDATATAYYPLAGKYESRPGQTWRVSNVGAYGSYWSSTVNGNNACNLNFSNSAVNSSRSDQRSFGFPVRPCKE